jgi:hypothetical protein
MKRLLSILLALAFLASFTLNVSSAANYPTAIAVSHSGTAITEPERREDTVYITKTGKSITGPTVST